MPSTKKNTQKGIEFKIAPSKKSLKKHRKIGIQKINSESPQKRNMLLNQLQSDLSPKFVNPSEQKDQRVSLYRMKKLYDSIIDSTQKCEENNSMNNKSIEIVNNNDDREFLDKLTDFVDISEEISIPEKPKISDKKLKAIPVTIKIQLSQSLTNAFLANRELFDANHSLPVRRNLREKQTVFKIGNPTVLLTKNDVILPKNYNFRSKQKLKPNENLENIFPIVKESVKKNEPLENRSNSIIQMLNIKKKIEDVVKVKKVIKKITESQELKVVVKEAEKHSEISKELDDVEEVIERITKLPEITKTYFKSKKRENVVKMDEIIEIDYVKSTMLKNVVKMEEENDEIITKLPEITEIDVESIFVKMEDVIDNITEIPLESTTLENVVKMEEVIEKITEIPEITKLDVVKIEPEIYSDVILNNNNSNSRNNNSYGIGEIFWSKIGKFPQWPSIIVNPENDFSGNYIQSEAVIQIRFFGDLGRRGIVSSKRMTPYNGFEEMKNSKKQRISKQQQKCLELAIEQADSVLKLPIDKRIESYENLVKEELIKNAELKKINEKVKNIKKDLSFSRSSHISSTPIQLGVKRTHSTDDSNSIQFSKKIKLEPSERGFSAVRDRRIIKPKNVFVPQIQVKKIKVNRKDSIDSQSSGFSENTTYSHHNDHNDENALTTFELILEADKNKNYLFKNVSKDLVCLFCFKPNDLIKCIGNCSRLAHKQCHLTHLSLRKEILQNSKKKRNSDNSEILQKSTEAHITGNLTPISIDSGIDEFITDFKCSDCSDDIIPECFVCLQSDETPRLSCKINGCGKYFHEKCLRYWPQANVDLSNNSLTCPSHCCQTCISEDPQGKFITLSKENVKCILCPSAYHKDSRCIPAGTEFLSQTQIICPRHFVNQDSISHSNWCFFCGINGGEIICCDTCPITIHKQCLTIELASDEFYMCEECESGRLPLYGEIVWAKFAAFRFWPSIIIPPIGIPDNIRTHKRFRGDVCIKYFGTNQYGWIGRGRIYLYQEDDYDELKKDKDVSYQKSMEEAYEMYQLLKNNCTKDRQMDRQKPKPYKQIKTNSFVYPVKREDLFNENTNSCNCKETDDDPCGLTSSCLNRITFFLCNKDYCPAGNKCANQGFEERIQPKVDVRPFAGKGFGLIALEYIKAGTFIIEYIGEVINDTEFKQRFNKLIETRDNNFYFLSIDNKYRIDAGPKGNKSRFMNHSCEPNCITQVWNASFGVTRVGIFANRDIKKHEELTFNYYFSTTGERKQICYCGSKKCGKFIGAKFKETRAAAPKTTQKFKLKTLGLKFTETKSSFKEINFVCK